MSAPTDLSLVKDVRPFPDPDHPGTKRRRLFWAVDGTGLSYLDGCIRGGNLAVEYISHMSRSDGPLLQWIVSHMRLKANPSEGERGLQVGFLTAITHFLAYASPTAPAFADSFEAWTKEGLANHEELKRRARA